MIGVDNFLVQSLLGQATASAQAATQAASRANGANGPNGPNGSENSSRADAVAEDFEAFFLSQVIEQMFAGISTDGPFGGGQGEKIFRSLMNQEMGRSMARNGGVGIAASVRAVMIRAQESESQ